MNPTTPLLMFIVLAILIIAGIPVAFSLLFTAIVFGLTVYGWQGVDLVIYAFWNVMNNFTLVAIPLFIFMSALLERSGVVEDMYKALRDIVGNVRGAFFIIMLLLGYIIGAMSGIAATGVISLAMIVYPIAKKAYPEAEDMAIGLTVFAGTLPQLIPPSLNMIVYSSMTGVPVSKLFAGGLVMGTILTVAAMIYIALYCVLHKDKVPKLVVEALPIKERIASLLKLLPPLAIILATLGSILSGLATPTEASGVGALATLLYMAMARRLSKSVLKESLLTTVRLSAVVGLIVVGAQAFSSVFAFVGGYTMLSNTILSIPKHLAITALIIFIIFLGMFLETVSIASIVGPLTDYIIRNLGLDPIWWGNIFCFTLMTAFLTPPVGMGVYLFKGVIRDVPMSRIFRASVPFLIIELLLVVVFTVFPKLLQFP